MDTKKNQFLSNGITPIYMILTVTGMNDLSAKYLHITRVLLLANVNEDGGTGYQFNCKCHAVMWAYTRAVTSPFPLQRV